ncbi:hypothetical protein BUALT_Bualt02G0049400 [Buddleja alternifolia]|uniref:Uncharacterized protein n=1 Tax=Buddleja alternifolia TaxID=168488 RepID=A0AAV6Y4M7_9LAMI|nr:hypothetical protein BUALT_Bualt02G0049400 [Buddleja alternifolia]
MIDAIVSMVLNRLTPLIEKKVKEQVCLLFNGKNKVESLSAKLMKIHHVLADAERKGVTDPRVKSWLEKLQEIAYEIGDVLDEWEIENLKQLLEESDDASRSCGDPWQKRLDSVAQENENEFKFIPNVTCDSQDFERIESTSFVNVSEVYGRDSDKETLMSKLLSESSSQGEDKIQIISIVAAGGMGKTTLAQLVFNEIKKKNEFKPIWVCVSDPFDGIKIAQTILNELGSLYPANSQFETLLNCIEKAISRKKIFLVLDDVWTDNDTMWKPLKKSLQSGDVGSRILVTTRKKIVAGVMGNNNIHSLDPLSYSDCWSLLSQIAFHNRRDCNLEMLKDTGQEIAKKCKGMPLAAMTMGGLLHFKSGVQEWQNVLKSEMWELEKFGDGIDFSLYPKLRSLFSRNLAIPPNLFSHLKRARLLSLGNLEGIPKEIGNLIHIRYLDSGPPLVLKGELRGANPSTRGLGWATTNKRRKKDQSLSLRAFLLNIAVVAVVALHDQIEAASSPNLLTLE